MFDIVVGYKQQCELLDMEWYDEVSLLLKIQKHYLRQNDPLLVNTVKLYYSAKTFLCSDVNYHERNPSY